MTQRFFRTADSVLYESMRQHLDAAWGLDEHGCTCVTPADAAPRDAASRIVLAVNAEFCDYAEVATVLPGLLASGAVEEIDEATYMATVAYPPAWLQASPLLALR